MRILSLLLLVTFAAAAQKQAAHASTEFRVCGE